MNIVEDNLRRIANLYVRFEENSNISDVKTVKKTFKERFFSLPWRPWITTKTVKSPTMYIMKDGTILLSPATKAMIDDILLENPVSHV